MAAAVPTPDPRPVEPATIVAFMSALTACVPVLEISFCMAS